MTNINLNEKALEDLTSTWEAIQTQLSKGMTVTKESFEKMMKTVKSVLKAANTDKNDPEGKGKIQRFFSATWDLVVRVWNAIIEFFKMIGRNIAKLFSKNTVKQAAGLKSVKQDNKVVDIADAA